MVNIASPLSARRREPVHPSLIRMVLYQESGHHLTLMRVVLYQESGHHLTLMRVILYQEQCHPLTLVDRYIHILRVREQGQDMTVGVAVLPLQISRGCFRVLPLTVFGGHGEEFADDYYSKEDDDDDEDIVQTPLHPSTPTGSNVGDSIGSLKPEVFKKGQRFGDHNVHSEIVKMFWESMSEPWHSFLRIPMPSIKQMFARFGEQSIFVAFENTLKIHFRDRTGDARKASAKLAMKVGIALPMTVDKKRESLPKY